MPERGRRGLHGLFGDLYRELSPPVRICLFAGLGLGFMLGVYFVASVPPDQAAGRPVYRTDPRLFALFILGLTVGGAVLGCVAGVLLDFALRRDGGMHDKKRRGKKTRLGKQ